MIYRQFVRLTLQLLLITATGKHLHAMDHLNGSKHDKYNDFYVDTVIKHLYSKSTRLGRQYKDRFKVKRPAGKSHIKNLFPVK